MVIKRTKADWRKLENAQAVSGKTKKAWCRDEGINYTEIWRQGDEMYYSKRCADEDYIVLKFTAQKGRYYHHFKSEDFTV